jgi:hypothetical protein
MPESLTRITGRFHLPSGETPTNGRAYFQMVSWDSSGSDVFLPGPSGFQLDENGDLIDCYLQNTVSNDLQRPYLPVVTYWSTVQNKLVSVPFPMISVPAVVEVALADLLAAPVTIPVSPETLAQCIASAVWAADSADRVLLATGQAEAAAVIALDAQSSILIYSSASVIAGTTLPLGTTHLRTNGYNSNGDGGGALYVASASLTAGGLQSADGQYWKLEEGENNLLSFGATVDAAVSAAEASSLDEIYVPEGSYATTIATTKRYVGLGKLVQSGTAHAKTYSRVTELPAFGLYFAGDDRFTAPEEFIIEASVDRTAIDTPYYYYPLIQHFNRSTFRSGHSGYDADITGGGTAGTNNLFVNDVTPFTVGDTVIVSPYTSVAETAVISAINVSTKLISFNFALVNTHPSTGIHALSLGKRTHTATYQTEFSVEGSRTGGDFIAHNMRIAANPTHNAGRDHCFDRTTIGFMGGDAFGLTDGVYIAGNEHHYYDKGTGTAADIFVIDSTKSFIRENNTGARGAVWLGTLYKSEGTKYANAAHVITGKWLRGIDTALADLGTDQAALSHKFGHRHYWGSTANNDLDGFAFWGAALGTVFTTGNTDGTGVYWAVNAGGAQSLTARPTGVGVGGTLTVSDVIIGAKDISVPQGFKLRLNGSSGNTYLTFDGSNVYLITNGGTPKNLTI